jgi:hypothetical protein
MTPPLLSGCEVPSARPPGEMIDKAAGVSTHPTAKLSLWNGQVRLRPQSVKTLADVRNGSFATDTACAGKRSTSGMVRKLT